tara:strand:- start:1691 stop:2542 length:852 start_codon:yes stop_codon:yes gene_type:complete
MIIWLASYPKSGNTFVRAFLSSYYYSKDGNFDFGLFENIKQFPNEEFFEKKLKNIDEASKEWVSAQKKIIANKKIKFFKTHSCMATYKERPFTTAETTLGAIYIVRDPRNVFTSMKNHFSMNDDDIMEMIMDNQRGLISDEGVFSTYTLISSWANHYNSWSKTNHFRRLIIKYEDLISNSYETFRDIVVFTNTLINRTEGVDKNKLINAIKSTDFKTLKSKEIKDGLNKSVTSFKKWRKVHKENKNLFFNLGPQNNWKKLMNKNLSNKIEEKFKEEMLDLGYL